MELEVQKILSEQGFDKAKEIFAENDLSWSVQESPKTGRKYLHIDYGIKAPRKSNLVKECRGIALHWGSWEIARYGFYRFMNFGETGADNFDPSQPVKFEEKADGSIIIVWHDDQEGWVAGTRGRVFNDAKMVNGKPFADYFWEISKIDPEKHLVPGWTYVYELCSIHNRIVVYYPEPHVVLLGGRYKDSAEIKDDYLDVIAKHQNVRRPKIYDFDSLEDAVANSKVLPGTEEGYIAKQWDDPKCRYRRVKIKGDSYKDLHMTFSAKSLNNLVRLVLRNDRSYFELFPEYLPAFDALREFFTNLAEEADQVWEENKWILDDLTIPANEKRKKFAQAVMKTKFGNHCFARADGKVGSLWEEYERALEVKSRTKKYISQYKLEKLVDATWQTEVEEED